MSEPLPAAGVVVIEHRHGAATMRVSAGGWALPVIPNRADPPPASAAGRSISGDAIVRTSGDALRYDRRPPAAGSATAGTERAVGVALVTTAGAAAAIAAGAHQIRVVDGRTLRYPSQDLAKIESRSPDRPGQTHALERHVGTTLADNVARLSAAPLLRAAGSYTSLADAQSATDQTIANPANQREIGSFLADPGRLKTALERVDLGRAVGASTLQSDVAAGTPSLIPDATATVVLIKDPTFPEGYRVLTTYPDTGRPEVDQRGNPYS